MSAMSEQHAFKDPAPDDVLAPSEGAGTSALETVVETLRTTEPEKQYGRLRLRRLSSVKSRSVQWVVRGLIPLRTLTLLAGVGGLGKSTWAAGVAAAESRGDYDEGTPHNVMVITYEDTAEEVWKPRILAANGDPDRLIDVRVGLDDGGVVVLPADLDDVEAAIRDLGIRLVVIDPLVAAIDLKLDSHKDQHVRSVLGKLVNLADETSAAVLGIGHLNKAPSQDAYVRVANSVAFWNAARSVVLVTKEEDGHRLVSQAKANWGKEHPVRRYSMDEIVLPDEIDPDTGLPVVTSRMTYVGDADDIDVAHVLRDSHDAGTGAKETNAILFLVRALRGGEWHPSSDVKRAAEAEGIKERTIQRAASDIEIEYVSRGFPRETYWRLPQSRHAPTPSDGATEGTRMVEPKTTLESTVAPARQGVIEDGATGRPRGSSQSRK